MLKHFHALVRRVPVTEQVASYAVALASATRPGREGSLDFVNEWVSWGAGIRAAQTLVLAGKARALLQGRACDSRRYFAFGQASGSRHRVLTSYKAEAEGVTIEQIIERLVDTVKPGA